MAIVQDRWKLVKALDEDSLFEMYDLAADPREQNDLAWSDVVRRESLEHDLDTFRDLDRWP